MESTDDNRNLINMSQPFDSSSPQATTRERIESQNKIIIQQAELIAQLQQENISLKKTLGARDVSSRIVDEVISFEHLCSEILSEIFKRLSVHDLKNSRLVCTKWNVVAVSQQPAQLILNVDKFMDQNRRKRREKHITKLNVQQLEKQLTRRIQFDKCLNWEGNLERNFEGLAAIIGTNVKEIRFHSKKKVQVPPIFCNFLQNKTFPNLSTISGKFFVSDLQDQIALGSLDTLKTIDVRTKKGFLQALIDSAPNLECLTFRGNIIKLPESSKLKSLEYTAKTLLDNYELKKLFNLIMTCNSTLSSLYLLSQHMQYRQNIEIFVLPKIPNLLKLKLSGQFQQHVGASVCNFIPKNLPKLESLCLLDISKGHFINFSFIDEFQQDFAIPTLKSLKVGVIEGARRVFSHVKIFFPNVKSLDIVDTGDLEEVFECVKDFDLESLKIFIVHPFKSSSIVYLLRDHYALLFKGLKTITFENQIYKTKFECSGREWEAMSNMSDYDLKEFKKIFLSVKEFEGLEVIFHNFKFNASIGQELMNYILENKIAGRFTCDTYY